jgi:regulator of RNase E activity RraB
MATPFLKVYEAFLARITADEWTLEEELAIVERDWQELLKMAVERFKYPRISLEIETIENNDGQVAMQFKEELTNAEIQMLALYMKHEWVKRCIASWENIR